MPAKSVREFVVELRRMQTLGFTGMFSGRLHRKSTGEAAVRLGLAERKELVVCDGDGFAKDPERWRSGYVLTDKGRELADREEPEP